MIGKDEKRLGLFEALLNPLYAAGRKGVQTSYQRISKKRLEYL